jgi:hypothetical protein
LENYQVKSLTNCPNWKAKDILGNKIENKKIICVEDEKAKMLLEAIISNQNCDLLNHLDIIKCDGDSKIITILEAINSIGLTNFIGVLDGDYNIAEYQKKRVAAHKPKLKNLIKLPGEDIPEKMVIDCIENNLGLFASKISKSIPQVKDAVTTAKTKVDHHEWVSSIAIQLGQNRDFVWEIMIKIWMENNPSEVEMFHSEFIKEFSTP